MSNIFTEFPTKVGGGCLLKRTRFNLIQKILLKFHLKLSRGFVFFGGTGEIDTHLYLMKNNESCYAPKCLKPSGMIDWVKCNVCKGWGYLKCANSTRAEARNLAEFNCARCSTENTAPICKGGLFRPDKVFIQASSICLKRKFLKPRVNSLLKP